MRTSSRPGTPVGIFKGLLIREKIKRHRRKRQGGKTVRWSSPALLSQKRCVCEARGTTRCQQRQKDCRVGDLSPAPGTVTRLAAALELRAFLWGATALNGI